ncbi:MULTISPECIES: 3-(methylthio)propionyl-CoA ligase [Gulbenkiania]|uniref:Acyl-CoA synthetase (AMP-forming)/AMP-acid ligase II n=2 Tax=Gulbenkiania TaxID=397456 RepID=A0A0K6GTD1_9NEIS|nr:MULTISPECIES: 3-(methylthio)propionyl-CoA ligase [Gulbenkiania]TCW31673.1 fatty-acyl-CoA synthase [Gulbenkiania mobilis]CUA81798.1 Acyl-CoA synthetase (AMP-forming)/AMP-acid ligase II [Gulbenkiania indica]
MMLRGQMMTQPLLISALLTHAETYHGDTEIVSRTVEGPIHRYTYRDAAKRARQLANGLISLGVRPGDRVGTLAWNGYRHYEIYYAVSGMGAVCHTVNPRLFAEQIAYIIEHAEDTVLLFDLTFLPVVEQLAAHLKSVRHFVLLTDRAHMPAHTAIPDLLCYEDLVNSHSDRYAWPEFDEETASSLCYTSGTTGNPKGVLYSHRSTVLHAFASSLPDSLDISAESCVMPVVPMFHVNAWGLPYSCTMNGAKLVLPGPKMDAISLYELIESEGVTMTAGVPTVWMMLLQHCEKNRLRIHSLKRVIVGGSAAPESMIDQLAEHGAELRQLWGMTELSPCGTTSTPKFKHRDSATAVLRSLQTKQGRPIYGVQIRIVDDAGEPLPHDGVAFGNLQVKGPWVLSQYFRRDLDASHTEDGWFNTGDVVTIDPDGYMKITDRTKDVIKSGGEWISSIELENILVGHPAVAEAAAIGITHPKWDERPLMVVVLKPGASATRDELIGFYEGKIAKWWTPDEVVFVEELPHTATGKLQKMKLREQFRDFRWPE